MAMGIDDSPKGNQELGCRTAKGRYKARQRGYCCIETPWSPIVNGDLGGTPSPGSAISLLSEKETALFRVTIRDIFAFTVKSGSGVSIPASENGHRTSERAGPSS